MSNDERGEVQSIWTCARARREDAPQSDGLAVLDAIDRLRRELTGYHGQLKAWGDLKTHADRQRVRIGELEGLYAKAKAERNELRGENDRLLVKLRAEHALAEQLGHWHEQAKEENERLRKLVRKLWRARVDACVLDGCEVDPDDADMVEELGIEEES